MPKSAEPAARTRWAGVAPEDRRAERRTLLLDAALDLLGTEGWSATTVRGVCQRARLNPRYFYEGFDDLDALVVAVHDRIVDELRAEVTAAIAGAGDDPVAQTRALVEATVRFVDDDRRRGRVLYREALGNEALNRRRIESGAALSAMVGEQLGPVAAAMLVGGFTEILSAWLDGRIDLPRARLVDDTSALFLRIAAISRGASSPR